jgi:hypothetical protein
VIPAETLAAWDAAYRRAEYRVALPQGELVLKVDRHDAADERRLRDEAAVQGRWAIVTPCNPDSQLLSTEENAGLLAQLAEIVEGLSLACISSVNRDPSGQWPDEPGILLCDPPPGFAEELGRHFRQNAILAGKLGEAPQLVWLVDQELVRG